MEILEGIFTRRSIRKYSNKIIGPESIQILLKAGMQAPSARNQQPWHFIVINDNTVLNRISEIHPHAKMLSSASLAIMVCGDESLELSKDYWVVDCSAATENILLAAHGLGLGAVWLGVHPREERKQALKVFFSLPPHIHPLSLISIGYPAETKETEDRFKPERVHYNVW